jgi:hypothetical protein
MHVLDVGCGLGGAARYVAKQRLIASSDPPQLSFRYEDLLRRTTRMCDGEARVGSSVAQALVQMERIASTVQEAPVIEWDEDALDIVEPLFLFFLHCSPYLNKLAEK